MVPWKPPSRLLLIQRLRALSKQIHIVTSENESLKQSVTSANGHINVFERSCDFRYRARDNATIWKKDTEQDVRKYIDISGNAVVVPRTNPNVIVPPASISSTLGIDEPVVPFNKSNTAFRIQFGNKGRAGANDVKTFLQQAKDRAPHGWKIQRERTPLTMQRERSLNTINTNIQQALSTIPSCDGLKTHVSTNGTNIFLSYADRQDTLDPQNKDAPAYKYPVWEHFTYDPRLKNGYGGLDYKKVVNLDRRKMCLLSNRLFHLYFHLAMGMSTRTMPQATQDHGARLLKRTALSDFNWASLTCYYTHSEYLLGTIATWQRSHDV